MASFPIPRGYSPLRKALDLAFLEWGSKDRIGGLKGLLISGELRSWAVDNSGKKTPYPADTWADPKNNYLLSEPLDESRIEYVEPKSGIVFLTADLDRVFAIPPAAAQNYNSPAADRKSNGGRTGGDGLGGDVDRNNSNRLRGTDRS